MKKKLFALLLAASAATALAFGIAGCASGGADTSDTHKWGNEYSFAAAYAQAQELGYAGTLDEFVEMISGKNGKDGLTPQIGENGNWFIGETDTGVKAAGADGTDGKDANGVKDISFNDDNDIIVEWTDGSTTNLGKVPACRHSFGDWQIAIEPDCTSIGVSYRVCSACGDKDYDFKECVPDGHSWKDNVCTKCRYDAGGTKNLAWELNEDNTYTLTGLSSGGFSGELDVPATYNGLPVKKVGDSAFLNNIGLRSVIIRDGVTAIGDSAFQRCLDLSQVRLPDSITSIGVYAFRDCNILSSINLPNGVESIETDAFRGCDSLTHIFIPENVKHIGAGAFSDCAALQNIIAENNENYYTVSNCLIEKKTKTIVAIRNLTDVQPDIIPADGSVTAIGAGVFRLVKIESIIIPESITTIGEYAFSGCSYLQNVTIPQSVTAIEYGAFNACSALTEIFIHKNVSAIGEAVFANCKKLYSVTVDPNNASYYTDGNCLIEKQTKTLIAVFDTANLKADCIPADGSVTAIGDDVFNFCSTLMEIIIPDGITRIGDRAFYSCTALGNVTLPDSVKTIGINAFYRCRSITEIVLPEGLESLGQGAFAMCNNLKKVTLPATVKTISNSIFANCDCLEDIVFNGTKSQWDEIEKDAMQWCGIYNPELKVKCTDGYVESIIDTEE